MPNPLNLNNLYMVLGMVVIVMGGWFFIEHRINEVVRKAAEDHIDTHAARHGQLPPGVALPYIKKGQTAFPDGWGLCSPSLDKLFLVGTTSLEQVGHQVGSPKHDHSVSVDTDYGKGEERGTPEAADNYPHGGINRPHKHHGTGGTNEVDHLPPAMQVVFMCKVVESD